MKGRDKPLILILLKRAAIFLFVFCAVSLFYYAVGSASLFLDETEEMLLDIARLSSLGVLAAAAIGLVLSFAYAVAGRYRLRAWGIAGYLASALFGAVALVFAQAVTILSQGLH
jgi:hypothetical protein